MPKPSWFDPKVTLGNVLTMISMLGVLFAGYINLKLDVQAGSNALAELKEQIEPLIDVPARVTALETRSAIVGPQRDAFQVRITAAVEKQDDKLNVILQQQARILAIIDPQRPGP